MTPIAGRRRGEELRAVFRDATEAREIPGPHGRGMSRSRVALAVLLALVVALGLSAGTADTVVDEEEGLLGPSPVLQQGRVPMLDHDTCNQAAIAHPVPQLSHQLDPRFYVCRAEIRGS